MTILRQLLTGTTTLASGSATTTVTLGTALLDTSKAFIVAMAEPGNASPEFGSFTYQILSTTQIRFQRFTATSAPVQNIRWYVAEFSSGITVQRGSLTTSSTPITATITAVDLSKSFIIGSTRSSGSGYNQDDFVELDFQSSTLLRARVNTTATQIATEWQVIEYADCSVQSGRVTSWTTAQTPPVTIASVDTSKTLLLFSYQQNGATASGIGQKLVRGAIASSTTLIFDRDATGSTVELSWFAITFTDATVQRGSTTFGVSDTSLPATITDVDTSRSIPLLTGLDQRHGTANYPTDDHPGISGFIPVFTSSTQLSLTRGFTASNTVGAIANWQVIEFTATIAPTGIAPTGGVGSPTLTLLTQTVAPTGIAATGGVGSPVVTLLNQAIAPTGIAPSGGVGSPLITLAGSQVLTPTGIAPTGGVGTPALIKEIESLLPPSIKDERFLTAEQVFYRITELPLEPLNIYDFDNVDASALPHLTEQFNVTGYRGWLLADTEQKKRNLLKAAIELHRYAGTPWAIKNALTTLGYGDVTIQENPGARFDGEYSFDGSTRFSGKAYGTFRVNLNIGGRSLPPAEIDLIIKLIGEWKNARSHLIEVIFTNFARYDGQIYFNGVYNFGGQPI
ncbi:MAG: phage tail protein [Oculatellaceae cyanobacterium bins.114]|nr:phage tail protein [Oculatellaceae cyanobacterium bins.114]